MGIWQIVKSVFICFIVNQAVAVQVCQDDQLAVEFPGGNVTCLKCPKCPPGSGATAPCGGTVPYNTSVECQDCMPEYYSDSFSSDICKPCSTCMPDEVIVAKCTKISDTRCSFKPCPKGYYRNRTMSKCLPCSKTFINQQGILQSCKTCSTEEEVLVNCSAKSDTICGGCKPGFYFNKKSKSCEECFWCCSHGDSQKIKNCVREGMLFAEFYHSTLPRQLLLPLLVNMQPHQVNQKEGYLIEFLELGKSKVCLSIAVLIVLLILVLHYFVQRRNGCENNGVSHEITDQEKMECMPLPKKHLSETKTETTCPLTTDTKKVDSEYPVRHNSDHKLVFEKTGVELISLDSNKSTLQHVTSDFSLQALSDWLDMPGLLEDGELPLSPIIKFISSTKLDGPLEVQIPHGANMVLSSKKWKIILKELQNDKWVVVSDEDGHGIKRFVPKSNHVSFEADHLSTFVVVGYCDRHSLSALKRMKVVAFCSETRVGEDLVVRLYCFDDCEWSFEKLLQTEQAKGGRLISSIESLDFSVTCKEDVEVSIKDSDGWKLESGCAMNFSFTSLRNSFLIIPQCNLVFKATSAEGNNTFFATIVLTQSSSQTVMYASAAIKENPTLHLNLNLFPTVNEGVHKSEMGNTSTCNQGEQKGAIANCIIQL